MVFSNNRPIIRQCSNMTFSLIYHDNYRIFCLVSRLLPGGATPNQGRGRTRPLFQGFPMSTSQDLPSKAIPSRTNQIPVGGAMSKGAIPRVLLRRPVLTALFGVLPIVVTFALGAQPTRMLEEFGWGEEGVAKLSFYQDSSERLCALIAMNRAPSFVHPKAFSFRRVGKGVPKASRRPIRFGFTPRETDSGPAIGESCVGGHERALPDSRDQIQVTLRGRRGHGQ